MTLVFTVWPRWIIKKNDVISFFDGHINWTKPPYPFYLSSISRPKDCNNTNASSIFDKLDSWINCVQSVSRIGSPWLLVLLVFTFVQNNKRWKFKITFFQNQQSAHAKILAQNEILTNFATVFWHNAPRHLHFHFFSSICLSILILYIITRGFRGRVPCRKLIESIYNPIKTPPIWWSDSAWVWGSIAGVAGPIYTIINPLPLVIC